MQVIGQSRPQQQQQTPPPWNLKIQAKANNFHFHFNLKLKFNFRKFHVILGSPKPTFKSKLVRIFQKFRPKRAKKLQSPQKGFSVKPILLLFVAAMLFSSSGFYLQKLFNFDEARVLRLIGKALNYAANSKWKPATAEGKMQRAFGGSLSVGAKIVVHPC